MVLLEDNPEIYHCCFLLLLLALMFFVFFFLGRIHGLDDAKMLKPRVSRDWMYRNISLKTRA